MATIEWEDIKDTKRVDPADHTKKRVIAYRAKVFGGWLVKTRAGDGDRSPTMAFVPDPKHEWE